MTVISASRINTYNSCPRQYYIQYIVKAPPVTTSKALTFGSDVHGQIAKLDFKSDDKKKQKMLDRAKKFLSEMPPNPVFETTYEDKNNPGRFFGEILGERAVAIMDVYWLDPYYLGADWKTGKFHSQYTDGYEVQAYFCSELYRQKTDNKLKDLYFNFIAHNDKIYRAKVLNDEKVRDKVETSIKSTLLNIEEGNFQKPKFGCGLCKSACSYRAICNESGL